MGFRVLGLGLRSCRVLGLGLFVKVQDFWFGASGLGAWGS